MRAAAGAGAGEALSSEQSGERAGSRRAGARRARVQVRAKHSLGSEAGCVYPRTRALSAQRCLETHQGGRVRWESEPLNPGHESCCCWRPPGHLAPSLAAQQILCRTEE